MSELDVGAVAGGGLVAVSPVQEHPLPVEHGEVAVTSSSLSQALPLARIRVLQGDARLHDVAVQLEVMHFAIVSPLRLTPQQSVD